MDGASDVPPAPEMGSDQNTMGAEPTGNTIDGGQEMGSDPMNGGQDIGGDPMNGGQEIGDDQNDMDGGPMNEPDMGSDSEDGDDSTMSIINKLTDADREAVRAYAESMLNREETSGDDEMNIGDDEMNIGDDENNSDQGEQMMEQFLFTKGQVLSLNEKLGAKKTAGLDDDSKPLNKKNTSKTVSAKSPFSPKKFK